MTVGAGFAHQVRQAGADPFIGVVREPQFLGDCVGLFESHAPNVVDEAIGVLGNSLLGRASIRFVNFMGQVDAYGAFLKEQHEFADGFLALPRVLDFLQDLFADPAYFQKPKRLVIEDVKGLKPEDFDDFFRAHAADVGDEA